MQFLIQAAVFAFVAFLLWLRHRHKPGSAFGLLTLLGFTLLLYAVVNTAVDAASRRASTAWRGRAIKTTTLEETSGWLRARVTIDSGTELFGGLPLKADTLGQLQVWLADGREGLIRAADVRLFPQAPVLPYTAPIGGLGVILLAAGLVPRLARRVKPKA
jgi:hypothetical protein